MSWQAYAPDQSTFITLAVMTALGVGIWLIWKNLKGRQLDADLPKVVILGTGVGGILLSGASMFLSTNFGWSMGGNHAFLPYVFALIFLAISIAEFVMAYWLSYFLRQSNAAFFVIAILTMITGIAVSILAGQALIASQVDAQKQARLQASDAYQAALQQRENVNAQVQDLAVSRNAYNAAQLEIESDLQRAQQLMATNVQRGYSDCSQFPMQLCSIIANYKSRTNDLNAQLAPLQQRIKQNQAIVTQYNDFEAAKQYANELTSEPLPQAVKSANLPHIIWLSDLTGIEPNIVEAKLYIYLAIVSELVALVLLFFYGLGIKTDKAKQLPIADVTLNTVPAMDVGGRINSDGLVYLHRGEIVLTKEQAAQWVANNHSASDVPSHTANSYTASDMPSHSVNSHTANSHTANSHSASDMPSHTVIYKDMEFLPKEKSQVKAAKRSGFLDNCIKCNKVYPVKTWHQIYCPECSEARKESYAKARC